MYQNLLILCINTFKILGIRTIPVLTYVNSEILIKSNAEHFCRIIINFKYSFREKLRQIIQIQKLMDFQNSLLLMCTYTML